MAYRKQIRTRKAPPPLPFFSQALVHKGIVYLSGQIGTDPKSGKIVEGDVSDRTKQIIKNIDAVLTKAGSSLKDVIKVNIFLDDMDNFSKVNEVYAKTFKFDPKPVRTCVAVKQLPAGTDVEIECIAAVPIFRSKL